jgi:transcriptional regulator with XRE-family HTH domain
MTQAELAELVGINRTTISMWETNNSMPRADKLIQLANILGCTVDELLREEETFKE